MRRVTPLDNQQVSGRIGRAPVVASRLVGVRCPQEVRKGGKPLHTASIRVAGCFEPENEAGR